MNNPHANQIRLIFSLFIVPSSVWTDEHCETLDRIDSVKFDNDEVNNISPLELDFIRIASEYIDEWDIPIFESSALDCMEYM